MATFKVGDRVRCVESFGNDKIVGKLGTIIAKGIGSASWGCVF